MVRFGIPSPATTTTLARRARPCGVLGARRQASSTRRWSLVTGSGAADAHIETAYMGLVALSTYFSDARLAVPFEGRATSGATPASAAPRANAYRAKVAAKHHTPRLRLTPLTCFQHRQQESSM